MEKEFVPYELALELKQLGFDIPSVSGYSYSDSNNLLTQAILYQQAFRWFRHNGKVAEIFSQLLPSNKYKWGFKIQGVEGITDGFLTHEEAELECLKKLIEILSNKQVNVQNYFSK